MSHTILGDGDEGTPRAEPHAVRKQESVRQPRGWRDRISADEGHRAKTFKIQNNPPRFRYSMSSRGPNSVECEVVQRNTGIVDRAMEFNRVNAGARNHERFATRVGCRRLSQ